MLIDMDGVLGDIYYDLYVGFYIISSVIISPNFCQEVGKKCKYVDFEFKSCKKLSLCNC